MPEAKCVVDLWSPEAAAAWDELHKRTYPSWRRKLLAENTPEEEQAIFEERAILKEARRLYHIRLGIKDG
jgi:hypothetical protein